jgi:hypothetical protein
MNDLTLIRRLTAFLAQFNQGTPPVVPLFIKADGSLDRHKTLALPCYAGFCLEERRSS